MPEPTQAIKVLRDELALQTRHCKLLEAQEQALLACDRDRFSDLQADHARMLPELESQDKACRALLTDDGGEPLPLSALKETMPARHLTNLVALEDNLRQTLERVQGLTRRNQTLIQNELDYIAFTLDLFMEAGRSAENGYGHSRTGGNGRLTSRLFLDHRA